MAGALGSILLAAGSLMAAEVAPLDFLLGAAQALGRGDMGAFREVFDPAMPGLGALNRAAQALAAQAQVESRIDPVSMVAHSDRELLLDWSLEITQRGGVPGVTHRHAKVRCTLRLRGDTWRITSFEPADFFAPPPDMSALWNMFQEAASALNNGNVPQFLSFFDPAFAARTRLEQTIRADVAAGEVQPSLELAVNEGDDRLRTVSIDLALDLAAWDAIETGMDTNVPGALKTRKRDRVTFRVARNGKHWRIESFEPADFFELALP
jgi:hypothetical protein